MSGNTHDPGTASTCRPAKTWTTLTLAGARRASESGLMRVIASRHPLAHRPPEAPRAGDDVGGGERHVHGIADAGRAIPREALVQSHGWGAPLA